MRLLDAERDAVRADAILRTYFQTASAADAGVCDDEAFRLLLNAAEGEGGPLDGSL
jgi:hypothetical protein